MIERAILPRLRELLESFPVVALVGPRQAGKTTVALAVAKQLADGAQYVDLELPSDRAKLIDPEIYLRSHEGQLVILDEIQRSPEVFQTIRSLVDRGRRSGRRYGQYLVLGSASPDLLRQTSESLAGRIAYLELSPFVARELGHFGPAALDTLWLRGGYPESLLARSDRESFLWRSAFIRTYLERDMTEFAPRAPSETLYRLWQMLAHNQGQMVNVANLAAGIGVSGQTIGRYISIMSDLFLIRRLAPWAGNVQKRLVRAPKVYVRDSGLVHALLGIRDHESLLGHPVAGLSWESLMIENIADAVGDEARLWFYRSAAGAEIDVVLEFLDGERWAIEIKRSLSPKPTKGFSIGCVDVGATRRLMLYAGDEAYPIGDSTEAIPLAKLVDEVVRRGRA